MAGLTLAGWVADEEGEAGVVDAAAGSAFSVHEAAASATRRANGRLE
jgi:hypothetical protein